MKTVHIKAGELPWADAESFPGWSWKSLRDDPDGVSVSLWRLAPGGSDELHAHADAGSTSTLCAVSSTAAASPTRPATVCFVRSAYRIRPQAAPASRPCSSM